MLALESLSAFTENGLSLGLCSLSIESLGEVSSLAEAWRLLPDEGQGYVVCADCNRRFHPGEKQGLLIEAEVSDGRGTTTLLRSQGPNWKAWRWREQPGESYRYVEHTFLSSEPGTRPPNLVYRQYWTRQEESGLQVWRPIGARFCGFSQED